MSFGLTIKAELCQAPLQEESPCCLVAEAFGILLYCSSFSPGKLRISTLSAPLARRLPPLFQEAFQVEFDRQPPEEEPPQGKYLFTLEKPEKIQKIFQVLGYSPENLACHINFALLEEPCCLKAFVRGAFLAGGSASDPAKSYHLELSTSHHAVSGQLSALLHETPYHPKIVQRKGHSLCYFKQKAVILGFLRYLGAEDSAQEMEQISQHKNIKSAVNRQVNCDAANLEKAVEAAQNQIQAIRGLQFTGLLDTFPEKLQETANLRMIHPHCTLSELAELFSPPISKSALNHRLRKLMALAQEMEAQQKSRPTKKECKDA